MERTLYLNENKGLEVIRDGPSIWVKEDGKAGRRIPARLVGRVVVIGNLKLEAGVITLFTENDIPVTFMNMRGEEVAVTIPYNHHLPRHHEEQKVLLETEENIKRFKMWLYSKRRDFQLSAIKRLSRSVASLYISRGFRERDYQEFIKRFKPRGEEQWKVVNEIISNLFREMIIGCIMKSDLDPHTGIMHRRHNFGLALDICHIAGPDIDLQGIQFFRAGKGCASLIREMKGWAVSKEGMRILSTDLRTGKRYCYAYIFETIPPEGTELMGMSKYEAVSHPFVIEPSVDTKERYEYGDKISFGLILIGRAVEYLPYFIYTFEELGRMGIGKGRGKYRLTGVFLSVDAPS